MFSNAKKSALLVDFDNLAPRYGLRLVEALPNWLAWLEAGGFDPARRRRKFLAKRVYWNLTNDTHRYPFKRRGFDNVVCRAVRNKERASSADFDITIDAVELRHDFSQLKEVIILSFDSDFLTVLNHLQGKNVDVVGMADGADRPAQAFRQLAEIAIEKEAFEAAFGYEKPRWSWFGLRPRRRAQPVFAAEAPQPEPVAAPSLEKGRPPRRKNNAPVFDFAAAGAQIEVAAAQSPTPYLSKQFVARALESFPDFRVTPPHHWLGCFDYVKMAEAIAAVSPKLELRDNRSGRGRVLFYLGDNGEAAAAEA